MRIGVGAIALVLAIGMSACGGATAITDAGQPRGRTKEKRSCLQIVGGAQNEGVCTLEDGTPLVVVDSGSRLKLKTVSVQLRNLATIERLPDRHDKPVDPKNGVFLLVELTVTNHDKVPHRFNVGQTVLGVANVNYEERGPIERHGYWKALASVAEPKIPPGGTREGDVVFDIPRRDADRLVRAGRLFVANFGARPLVAAGPKRQIGFVRLYR